MSAGPLTVDWLRQQGGRVSFAQFMAAALYHPELGYYSRNVIGVGKRGDFSTSATLHPVLGRAIAAWLAGQWEERGTLPVVEVGGGDGSLASAIFSAFPWWKRWKLDYHLVDVSAPLVALQKNRLKQRNICWHQDLSSALRALGGRALIFSNELVDAFPCRLLRKSASGWDELFLRGDSGVVTEEREPLHPEVWSPWSACADEMKWKEGQRVEVQNSYRHWLAGWASEWKAGALLTIDYGAEREQLYWRRPRGTLRAYFSHHRLEGPDLYARMGRQDLTADVNFTDLRNWGEELGLKTLAVGSQSEFIQKYAGTTMNRISNEPAVSFLQNPLGPGEAFRVLIQGL